jgi:hypothetical protein
MSSILLLVFSLWIHPASAQADGLGARIPGDVSATATVAVGPLAIKASDLMTTEKPGYIHLMADLFPYRADIKAAGDRAKPETLAKGLVRELGLKRFPQATHFKVVLAEFPERDEYDAPRWDKIQILGRFEVTVQGKSLRLAKK